MGARGFRILCRSDPNLPYSVIVVSSRSENSLLLESSAAVTLEDSFLLVVTGVLSVGQINNCDIYRVSAVEFVPLRAPSEMVDPRVADLQRLMSSGMFYFAVGSSSDDQATLDLTLSAHKRAAGDTTDHRFFWNRNLHFPLERYGIDPSKWFVRMMCGSVQVRTMYVGNKTVKLAILSRLSCRRVGTRFNVRGVDDDGHVANFVETEQLLAHENCEASFIQVRGSVPLFWEQPGVNVGSHKIKLRAVEATAPAFNRHFSQLKQTYGDLVVVNLLGSKEGERTLSEAYKAHLDNSAHADTEFVAFDYHAQMKLSKNAIDILRNKLIPFLDRFSFFCIKDSKVLRSQCGIIRTNCLDCLDRTNSVQTMIGLQILGSQLQCLNIESTKVNVALRFEEALKDLWQKNGDSCSVVYAGTGAIEGKSKLKDASRSLARTIQNNLMDASKQESFDMLLLGSAYGSRLFDQVENLLPPLVIRECDNAVEWLVERAGEVVDVVPLTVFVGTWNVNGGKNMHNIAFRNQAPLTEWLFPNEQLISVNESNFHADIVAIALEEIIDLNASNIMKASTTNQRLWCDGLRKALLTKGKYVLLGCEQLVGVCLFVFVKPHLAPFIRDVAIDSVKTGMGGAAGNKGSIALRMTIYATSVCFVCSHFAAGQNEIRDRNEDFITALRRIKFPMGREILSHDIIFWMGDFNYRISLPGDVVKAAIRAEQFSQLVPNDQLTQQRAMGNTFMEFEEGTLNFAPTYKYDTFSDDYDTSEKCRAPAWTDRILWKDCTKRTAVKLQWYGRSELKTSDHRPVSALFRVAAFRVKPEKCKAVYEDVISSIGPPDATVLVSVDGATAFPVDLYYSVLDKLVQLGITPRLSKTRILMFIVWFMCNHLIYHFMFDGPDLWLILESGEMALAALSMDGVCVGNVQLNVRLRSPNWTDGEKIRIDSALQSFRSAADNVQYLTMDDTDRFEFDDDDEEMMSQSMTRPASPRRSPAPDRLLELEMTRPSVKSPQPVITADPSGPRPLSVPNMLAAVSAETGNGWAMRSEGGAVPNRPAPPPPDAISRSSSPWNRVPSDPHIQDSSYFPANTFNPTNKSGREDGGIPVAAIPAVFDRNCVPAIPPRPQFNS
uniref:phosphoinositide 5-phosphatase n=1 Tax=Ascaris lumbricoides TaxID=6252 RepID=A0A9J2P640_ASCLU